MYAVHKGRTVGIFQTWADCSASVTGFTGAKFKKFKDLEEAREFVRTGSVAAVAPGDRTLYRAVGATAVADPTLEPLEIHTDGSCGVCRGKRVASGGIYYGPNDPRNMRVVVPGPVKTNNRAELWAAIRAIETLQCPERQHVVINTDSKYTIRAVCEYYAKWLRTGFNGKTVLNQEMITRLHSLATGPRPISFAWVPGHRGIAGNEGADKLADFALADG